MKKGDSGAGYAEQVIISPVVDELRLSPPHGMYKNVSSTIVGTVSTSSRNTIAMLTVYAARILKPGSVSTKLKLRLEKERSISMMNF